MGEKVPKVALCTLFYQIIDITKNIIDPGTKTKFPTDERDGWGNEYSCRL